MFSERVISRIAAEFRLGDPLSCTGPAARGELGEMFRLETATGTFAVKRPFHPVNPSELEGAARFSEAARAHGVPAPRICRTRSGSVLLERDDLQVLVYDWVDLRVPDSGLDPASIGKVLAALHTIGFEGESPVHPWNVEPVGRRRWEEIGVELTAAGAAFAGDFDAIRDEIVGLEDLIESPEQLLTCHRDLFADNLRSTTGGELCVIDWDNYGLADPSQELGVVLYDFGNGDLERVRLLYRTYLEAGGPGRVSRPGHFSMAIAQLGHINERACARWLAAAPGDPERDRMAGLFGEFTDRPLTRELIGNILGVLGS